MASRGEELKAACAAAYVIIHILSKRKRKEKKRVWRSKFLAEREKDKSGENLLAELQLQSDSFRNFTKMSLGDFELLLRLISPKISKLDTKLRDAIPAKVRLAVTLRFLASGDSYASLMYVFKISRSTISLIVPEVCESLIEMLQSYVKVPSSEEEWLEVAQGFNSAWNFPHCIGAMDGKHVLLQAPADTGDTFINYKRTFGVVLMAVVDSSYNFLYANCGSQGWLSDGGVFRNTNFSKKLEKKELNVPVSAPLAGRRNLQPYVLVAGDAFALEENIMKPYPGAQGRNSSERVFNYRLSRARRVVENAIGLMSTVFQVLWKPMLLAPKKAETVILACVYLHNFLRRNAQAKATYSPPGTFDIEHIDGNAVTEGTWRREINCVVGVRDLALVGRRPTQAAANVRQEFKEYFMSQIGRVPWQDTHL